MSRPGPRMVPVNARIPAADRETLENIAADDGVTYSGVVRRAVAAEIKKARRKAKS